MAWWLMPRTPDPEVGGSSPTRVKPCCVLEQGTFTPQKVLVIPRKLCPNMTEKLLTGTLRINQSINLSDNGCSPENSKCSQLCLLKSEHLSQCKCTAGYKLNMTDGRSCDGMYQRSDSKVTI